MMTNSSKMLFQLTMIMGVFMSMSSNNWIMIWCGLEISLVSLSPLMVSKLMLSSESTMKYFIMQSISSSMLMLSMLIMIMSGDYNYDYILTTSLLIKMGIPPFHNWILTVLEGLNYWAMFITITMNKLGPMTLMNYFSTNIEMIIIMTVMTGAIMGLTQNSVNKLIGYSSIFNMGFMMSVMKYNLMWMLYLIVYSILVFMLILILKPMKIKFINQITFSKSMIKKISLWINMLSMGGMPPMVGFSIKFMVIKSMLDNNLLLVTMSMIFTSLIIMFFYLRMTFLSIMNNSLTNKVKLFNLNKTTMMLIFINVMTLPTTMMMKLLA